MDDIWSQEFLHNIDSAPLGHFPYIKNDIGSNFVERSRQWFSAKQFQSMKNMKKGTLHIWMNSHIFPKHYNFHKISIDNGQLCKTNLYKKNKFLCIIECIL